MRLALKLTCLLTTAALSIAITLSAQATKKVEIRDPSMNNMLAYTLTIPANWNFQGAILLDPSCGNIPSVVAYRVFSDDLRYGVQRIPEMSWYTPSDSRIALAPGCKKVDSLNAIQYAGMIMPTLRPNSRLISTSPAPEAPALDTMQKQMQQTLGASGARYGMPASTFGWDASQLRIEYNLGSQPEEEFLQVLQTTSDDPSPINASRPGQALHMQYAMNKHTTAWIVAERAPKGQLDASSARLETIRKSLTINPAWDQAVTDLIRQRGAAAIKNSWTSFHATYQAGEAAHKQLMANGQQFNANMQAQGEQRKADFAAHEQDRDRKNADFAAYEDSRSRHSADEVDYLLDRQYYVNPSNGQTSTISTTYSNNWQNGQGDTVVSNLQGFDPNGTVQGNWTQLQPIRH